MIREALTMDTLNGLAPQEAAALFVARRAEGLTSQEEQLLADWLAGNSARREAFDRADRAWSTFADSDSNEIISAMREHALAPRRRRAAWRPIAAGAAALLVAASVALIVLPNIRSAPPGVAPVQYASSRGEVREVSLADGSAMTL